MEVEKKEETEIEGMKTREERNMYKSTSFKNGTR